MNAARNLVAVQDELQFILPKLAFLATTTAVFGHAEDICEFSGPDWIGFSHLLTDLEEALDSVNRQVDEILETLKMEQL